MVTPVYKNTIFISIKNKEAGFIRIRESKDIKPASNYLISC